MTLRISNIEINRFRGISQKLGISFHTRGSEKPASLILAGDNGVGKSSIVDAFEYALLGRVNLQNLTRQFSPLSMSTKTIQECYIRVNFSDKSSITRAISEYQKEKFQEEYLYRNQTGKHITNRGPHPNFAIDYGGIKRIEGVRNNSLFRFLSFGVLHNRLNIIFDNYYYSPYKKKAENDISLRYKLGTSCHITKQSS